MALSFCPVLPWWLKGLANSVAATRCVSFPALHETWNMNLITIWDLFNFSCFQNKHRLMLIQFVLYCMKCLKYGPRFYPDYFRLLAVQLRFFQIGIKSGPFFMSFSVQCKCQTFMECIYFQNELFFVMAFLLSFSSSFQHERLALQFHEFPCIAGICSGTGSCPKKRKKKKNQLNFRLKL